MDTWIFLRRRWIVFLHDLSWVPLAVIAAFWIRFNLDVIPHINWLGAWSLMVMAMPINAFMFWLFGCYRGIWRFASVQDLLRIVKAVALGTLATALLLFLTTRMAHIPRSVIILYPLLMVLGLGGDRLIYRLFKNHMLGITHNRRARALVVGAGRAGELLIRDLKLHGTFDPVVLVDDDPAKLGHELHGVRVRGTLGDISHLVERYEIDTVLIALPSASRKTVEQVVQICNAGKIPCRTLPSIAELAGGKIEISRLRPVTVEDLLGRDPVTLDVSGIKNFLRGKRVLITGGGGSIGAELCRQVSQYEPEMLTILEQSENNLYHLNQSLASIRPSLVFNGVLGDAGSEHVVERLFAATKPQIILHAAAYKHVPILEDNVIEAIRNNIFCTCVLADASKRHGTEKFVLISTDKTVNPSSVMGTTKRVAELYCQSLNQDTGTEFVTTRFGNVLASAGSVVPLFERQIAAGGPLTVTHPDVTRYFMTISEAASLILQAGAIGRGGEIFVLDMGEPVRIRDLAEKMIKLSGLQPDVDIKIVYTGLRAGEKMQEELFYEKEELQATVHPKLLLASSVPIDSVAMGAGLKLLASAVEAFDDDQARTILHSLVPEFVTRITRSGTESANQIVALRLIKS